MLSNSEIDKLIINEYGPNADLGWHASLARDVERAAYERAAQECEPHEDDDSIDRQIKRELAERIRALGRQHD